MERAVALVCTGTKRQELDISTDCFGEGEYGHSSGDTIQLLFFAAEF